jgi:hypothetical protein
MMLYGQEQSNRAATQPYIPRRTHFQPIVAMISSLVWQSTWRIKVKTWLCGREIASKRGKTKSLRCHPGKPCLNNVQSASIYPPQYSPLFSPFWYAVNCKECSYVRFERVGGSNFELLPSCFDWNSVWPGF